MAEHRWVDLTGAYNVRDLAGLPAGRGRVRDRVLLRGDHLDGLTEHDVVMLRDTVGLRAIVDLRTRGEAPAPNDWIAAADIELLQIPLIDLSGTTAPKALLAELVADGAAAYRTMLAAAAPRMASIVSFLLEPGRSPALVHCAAGKDRTGIVVAVLLAAAGVETAAIVADYLGTAERISTVRRALRDSGRYRELQPGQNGGPAMSATAIEGVLDVLTAHDGAAAGFLLANGVSERDLHDWREHLLEPVAP